MGFATDDTHPVRRRQLCRALLGLALLLVPSPGRGVRAETDLGDMRLSGTYFVGGRAITGDDWGSAKFNEYRAIRPGAFTNGLLLLENQDRERYARSWIDYVSPDDQTYRLQLGHWGHYGLSLELLKFPHDFSSNARSPYSSPARGVLTLPPSWSFDPAALEPQLEALSRAVDLGFINYDGRARGFFYPHPDVELTADYQLRAKRGTRPQSISFGFPNFVTIPSPIDEQTHEIVLGAKLQRERFNASLDWTGSFFHNDLESVTIDNPINGTDQVGVSSRARVAALPDNSASRFTLSTAYNLDTEFPARLAGTFSYGIRLQDQLFLPETVNTALFPFDDPSSLPARHLDGHVNTWLGNLQFTTRPIRRLELKARYRIYDYDNQTDTISFGETVPDDQFVRNEPVRSIAYQYQRQNADLDLSYRVLSALELTAGYQWEGWNRSEDREVAHLNQHMGKLGLDYRLMPWASVRLGYRFGFRRGNNYSTQGTNMPQLRKFDEANRVQNVVDLLVRIDPREDLGFTLNGGFLDFDYDDSSFGTLDQRGWQAGVEASYQPLRWLRLDAYYTYDFSNYSQRSRERLPDDPGNDWNSRSNSTAHNGGVDLALDLVPERLEATLGYLIQRGRAQTRASGDRGAAVDYPDVTDTLQIARALLDFRVTERFSLQAEYRWEKWSHDDFQTDPLGLFLGGRDVYLNNHVDDYTANVISWGVQVDF